MAFYHVGSCSCPVGCCDCGETDKDRGERALRKEMYNFLEPLRFTALFKDITGDKRRNTIKPAYYVTVDKWREVFIRYVNEPSIEKAILIGHKFHERFKEEEFYTPAILRGLMYSVINTSYFTSEEIEGLNQYFKDLFTYTKVEVVSEWE